MLTKMLIGSLTTLVLVAPTTVSAATIAYYRFENGAFLNDSSGNNLALTKSGGASVTQEANTMFPGVVAQNGASNGMAAKNTEFDKPTFSTPSNALLDVSSLTLEGYIHLTAYNGSDTQYLGGRFNSGGNRRSYALGIAGSNGTGSANAYTPFLVVGDSATTSHVVASGLGALSLNTSYYLAVSFDGTTSVNDVTFYLKDLTTPGAVLTTSTVSSGVLSIYNFTELFGVGGTATQYGPKGFIDEVRLSNQVLASNELLVNAIPEPASLTLTALGGLMFLRRRRA